MLFSSYFYLNGFVIFFSFLLIKLNVKIALFLCSSLFREMQKFKRDFYSWCTECNQEKKDKQDKLLSEYETAEMVNNCVICILHAHTLHSRNGVAVTLIFITWLPTLSPVQLVLTNCYYLGISFFASLEW
jgi:hypothetical protein